MQKDFDTITKAFKEAGVNIKTVQYSITPYSLNTSLSFKFSNADDLLVFLSLSPTEDKDKIEQIHKAILDANLKPDSFFYVNFYKAKVAEL